MTTTDKPTISTVEELNHVLLRKHRVGLNVLGLSDSLLIDLINDPLLRKALAQPKIREGLRAVMEGRAAIAETEPSLAVGQAGVTAFARMQGSPLTRQLASYTAMLAASPYRIDPVNEENRS